MSFLPELKTSAYVLLVGCGISRALNVDPKTVLRYARAANADDLLTAMPRRGSELDAHTAHLAQRWQGAAPTPPA